MSESITATDFAKGIRAIGARFPISGSVKTKDGSEFLGTGTVTRTQDNFILHITFPIGAEPPKSEPGTYTSEDCWSFEGVVGINLRLAVEHLAPWGTSHFNNGVTSREFDTHTLSLPAPGCDGLPIRQVAALLNATQKVVDANGGEFPPDFHIELPPPTTIEPSSKKEKPSPYSNGVWIHALVPDFPLIHTNGGTEFIETNAFLGESKRNTTDTFSGSFDQVEFGMIRRGDDLNVYLFCPQLTDESLSAQIHEQFLTAFLTGLAFATGQHCWPFQVTIRQNGRLLVDKLHAVSKLDRTALAPFSERMGFNAKLGSIEWQFADFLGKATAFFNSATNLSEASSQALWLLRSADAKNVPSEITLMSLCVLLESLSGMIFDDEKLASGQVAGAFEGARVEVLNWIKKKSSADGSGRQRFQNVISRFLNWIMSKKPADASGFQRFQNIIFNARLERPKDKYRAVSDHFGLQWDGLMKEAWTIWEKVRNKGAHDILRKEKERKIDFHFTAVGRIAGAINVLVLRLIGYSGIARTSAFEDKHHKI